MTGLLDKRVAVVTGAARGIGLGISRRFVKEGASVLMVDQLADEIAAAAGELGDPGTVGTLVLDLTDDEAPARVASAAQKRFGRVDVVVNNAAIGLTGTLEDFSDADWHRILSVNLSAAFRLCRELVPPMAEAGWGRVLNISSMNGLIGMRSDAAYSVTKSGLQALTRSIAVDYGRRGVTANCIAPGPIETPLNSAILNGQSSWFVRTVVENKPVPGIGHVDDIGAAAAFLCSEEARFISGQVLAVDGGLSATRFVADDAPRTLC